jgi:hypothetical protein
VSNGVTVIVDQVNGDDIAASNDNGQTRFATIGGAIDFTGGFSDYCPITLVLVSGQTFSGATSFAAASVRFLIMIAVGYGR